MNVTTSKGKPVFEGYVSAASIAPSDVAVLVATKGLWVGVAGNIAVIMADGSTATFVGVPAGTELRLSVTAVKATGTTATSIVALW